MPCLLLVLGLAFPRVIIALLFFFSKYLDRVYSSFLLLLLGFFFLPLTTLIYAFILNSGHRVEGLYLVALVLCAVADLGLIGGGANSRRSR